MSATACPGGSFSTGEFPVCSNREDTAWPPAGRQLRIASRTVNVPDSDHRNRQKVTTGT